tara:strand:- start:332 stop:469 length:138 start_codon:yes stop_codon:yes gene_type:complete
MKVRIFIVWSQVYITPYVKITHSRHLNGKLEFIIGWLKWEIVIGI